MKFKFYLKRVVGFIEFMMGILFPAAALYVWITKGIAHLEYRNIFGIPLVYGFIKYGWRWMTGTVNIEDEKNFKLTDICYVSAMATAQENIELFNAYLRKSTFPGLVYIPVNQTRYWIKVRYYDESSVVVDTTNDDSNQNFDYKIKPSFIKKIEKAYNVNDNEDEIIIPLKAIHDWIIFVDEKILGYYSFKAMAEKLKSQGYKLSNKNKDVLSKIVT